jgi:hypothetical protein
MALEPVGLHNGDRPAVASLYGVTAAAAAAGKEIDPCVRPGATERCPP